jgi:hypothetical protein
MRDENWSKASNKDESVKRKYKDVIVNQNAVLAVQVQG